MLPFTHEQFIGLFGTYNTEVWPAQIVAYVLALGMLAALWWRSRSRSRIIGMGLALMWLWTGAAYHWMFFTGINKAAWLFGALFATQGALLIVATVRKQLTFGATHALAEIVGWVFVLYAGLLYPLLGLAAGQQYPGMPMFGITPCPVTIFTFGMLLLTDGRVPRRLLVIPVLWSLIGGSAAIMLHVPQDWFLLFSGVAVLPIVLNGRRWARVVTA